MVLYILGLFLLWLSWSGGTAVSVCKSLHISGERRDETLSSDMGVVRIWFGGRRLVYISRLVADPWFRVVLLMAKPFIFALFAVWYQNKIGKI